MVGSSTGGRTGGRTIPGEAKNGSNRSFLPTGGGVGACGRIEKISLTSPERESGGVGGCDTGAGVTGPGTGNGSGSGFAASAGRVGCWCSSGSSCVVGGRLFGGWRDPAREKACQQKKKPAPTHHVVPQISCATK